MLCGMCLQVQVGLLCCSHWLQYENDQEHQLQKELLLRVSPVDCGALLTLHPVSGCFWLQRIPSVLSFFFLSFASLTMSQVFNLKSYIHAATQVKAQEVLPSQASQQPNVFQAARLPAPGQQAQLPPPPPQPLPLLPP